MLKSISAYMKDYSRRRCVHGQVTSNVLEISDNISETVQYTYLLTYLVEVED